jgi:hypothetical protein
LEGTIYIAVVATSLAILIPEVGAAIGKARLTGMLTLVRAPMLDVMERLALTGELKETEVVERQSPVSAEERRRRRAEVLAYKDRPDPAASADRRSGAAGDGGLQRPGVQADFLRNAFQTQLEQQAERETGRETFRFQVIGPSIVTYGAGANLPSFFLTFSPATTVDHTPATIIWLCGSRTAPSGWKVPGGFTPTNLPPQLLHSVCRGRVQPY